MTPWVCGQSRETLGSDRRGLVMPSLPMAIAIVLVVGIAVTAALFTFGIVESPLAAPTEVTTHYNDSVVADDGAVVVTVVEEGSQKPVAGATVVPSSEVIDGEESLERTAGENGTVTYRFGGDGVDVELGSTDDTGTIRFDVRPPEDGYVDRQRNAPLTVRRT